MTRSHDDKIEAWLSVELVRRTRDNWSVLTPSQASERLQKVYEQFEELHGAPKARQLRRLHADFETKRKKDVTLRKHTDDLLKERMGCGDKIRFAVARPK